MYSNKGFTLIELMVVVAIVATLAAVALPSYQQYVLAGKRAEGVAFALDIASRQERHFAQYSRYAITLTGTTSATVLAMVSANSENGEYTARITQDNGITTYTIIVDPNFADAECENLTLVNNGVRGETGSGTVADCWR
ncbi:MAG: type IV pilus assembly protein PilE [Cellvibrionaceae bacterium]|jgi:type IV pilus assembly protein PilE